MQASKKNTNVELDVETLWVGQILIGWEVAWKMKGKREMYVLTFML